MPCLRIRILTTFLLVLQLTTGTSWANPATEKIKAQWQIVENSSSDWPLYWLANTQYPELRQEVFLAGPIAHDKPWLSDVVEVDRDKGIYLITYYAGQPGTSELVDTYYALIYNAIKHTMLGHYPYRCSSSRYDYSPQWLFEKNRISISDDSFDPVVIDY